MSNLFDLTGSTAVVTGGAGTLGSRICEALAEAGAHIVIASRDLDRCTKLAERLNAAGHQASAQAYDQSQEDSILALRDRVIEQRGAVDILVNNSVLRPMQRYEDPLEAWRKSMDVNASGLFCISRAFLDPMMARRIGTLINIGSIQSVVAPDFGNYEGLDMTTPPDYHFHKHGLIGLTKYLAAFAGPSGVRVNAISPGAFENERLPDVFRERYLRRVLLGRMAQYDEIKGAVVFLASRASSYITGQNIIVDGGYCH